MTYTESTCVQTVVDIRRALQQKALIFTESRRTQEYLFQILEQTQFAGKVVLFNGSNTDPKSQQIYRAWVERHARTDRVTGSPRQTNVLR